MGWLYLSHALRSIVCDRLEISSEVARHQTKLYIRLWGDSNSAGTSGMTQSRGNAENWAGIVIYTQKHE